MTVLYPGQYRGVCPWPEGCLAHYGSGTGGTPGGGRSVRSRPSSSLSLPLARTRTALLLSGSGFAAVTMTRGSLPPLPAEDDPLAKAEEPDAASVHFDNVGRSHPAGRTSDPSLVRAEKAANDSWDGVVEGIRSDRENAEVAGTPW